MIKSLFRERRRSSAIRKLGLLEMPTDAVFKRFVDAAASAFKAPISMLSVIHDQEQWFKAAHGFEINCIARTDGFCTFALDRSGVLECSDPLGDDRFARLPSVVGEPHIRYYIGAPLRLLSGVDVGVLCVIDTVTRQPASADQKAYLQGLARQASMALEARLDIWGSAA
jgi:GAF domain-containing protein